MKSLPISHPVCPGTYYYCLGKEKSFVVEPRIGFGGANLGVKSSAEEHAESMMAQTEWVRGWAQTPLRSPPDSPLTPAAPGSARFSLADTSPAGSGAIGAHRGPEVSAASDHDTQSSDRGCACWGRLGCYRQTRERGGPGPSPLPWQVE